MTNGSSGGAQPVMLTALKIVSWFVYGVAVVAIGVLAFGFVLAMLGASTEASFSKTIYELSLVFLEPFKGMIANTELSNGGLISWNALIAMAAYAVLAALVGGVVNWASRKLYTVEHQQPSSASGENQPPTNPPGA